MPPDESTTEPTAASAFQLPPYTIAEAARELRQRCVILRHKSARNRERARVLCARAREITLRTQAQYEQTQVLLAKAAALEAQPVDTPERAVIKLQQCKVSTQRNTMTFGERIRLLRENWRPREPAPEYEGWSPPLSYRDLERFTGINYAWFWRIEQEGSNQSVSLERARILANFFEVSLDYLAGASPTLDPAPQEPRPWPHEHLRSAHNALATSPP